MRRVMIQLKMQLYSFVDVFLGGEVYGNIQWLFLVPLTGGRWHIIPQLAVYTTYILPSGGLYATYHLFGEP